VAQTQAIDKKHALEASQQQLSSGSAEIEETRQNKERSEKLKMKALQSRVEGAVEVQKDDADRIEQEAQQTQMESDLRISQAKANATMAEEALEAAHESAVEASGALNSTDHQLVVDRQHRGAAEELRDDYKTDINETAGKHVVASLRLRANQQAKDKETAAQQVVSADEEEVLQSKQAAVEAKTQAQQVLDQAEAAFDQSQQDLQQKQQQVADAKTKFEEDLERLSIKEARTMNNTADEHRQDEEVAIEDAQPEWLDITRPTKAQCSQQT